MVIVAAAQQSRFFEQISQSAGFWGGLAEACALIGFTVGVIGILLRRIGVLQGVTWFLIMVLMFAAPLNAHRLGAENNDRLFFTALQPEKYQWTRQPYRTFHPPPETRGAGGDYAPDIPPEPRTPLDDLKNIEQIKKGQPVFMFSPQLAMIDVLNHVRAAVGGSFVAESDGYKAPLADFSARNNETLKPLANFSTVMFGNIHQGMYSALLPMLLTFVMVIVIVCTPFILMLALMMPHWGPGLLLLTVGGVAYSKTVEIMFAMVHGILGLFLNLQRPDGPRNVATLNEVLLGLGYMVALLASIWLVYKVMQTGRGVHHLLRDLVRESQSVRNLQKLATQKLSQGATTRSLQTASLQTASLQTTGMLGGGSQQQALAAPLQQLPFDAGSQNNLYTKAARQKTAEQLRPDATPSPEEAQSALARAFAKTQKDALQKAKEQGVPKEARLPRAARDGSGRKTETNESGLSRVARALGGKTPEELSNSYQKATQLFSSGALAMRMDDNNTLRVEVNLSLEVMQTLPPELQDAVGKLQKDGFITRSIANGTPTFVLAE